MALIAGAMAGAGEAGVATGLQLQRQFSEENLLKMRAEAEQELARTTSQLRIGERAAGIEQDIAAEPRKQAAALPGEVAKAKAIPQKLAAGESLTEGGRITVTAPSPKETAGFYEAYKNYFNAKTEEIRAGTKEKGSFPHVIEQTNPDGTVRLYDQNSGAIGTIIPSQAAKAAVSHWFKADEPAKAAVPQVIQWTHGNRTLPGGLDDIYPAMKARSGGQPGSAAPGAPAAAAPQVGAPSQAAIAAVQKDPTLAPQFDAWYGKGSFEKYAKPAAAASTPAAAKGVVNKMVASPYEDYVKPLQRRGSAGGYYVDVPQMRGTNPLTSLRGKTFATRQEALDALSKLNPAATSPPSAE